VFLARRPSPQVIERFLSTSQALPLSYEQIGIAKQNPAGFHVDEHTSVVGHSAAAFERAKGALLAWKHFELGWMEVFPTNAAVAPGTVVAVLVSHLGFWSLNGCRVVYLLGNENPREFGFAYGTLSNHAEAGEETFKVSLSEETGAVTYQIRAVSRPRAFAARLGHPIARALQARFRRDSARALARAVSSD